MDSSPQMLLKPGLLWPLLSLDMIKRKAHCHGSVSKLILPVPLWPNPVQYLLKQAYQTLSRCLKAGFLTGFAETHLDNFTC